MSAKKKPTKCPPCDAPWPRRFVDREQLKADFPEEQVMTKPTKKPPGIESDGAILPIGPFEPVESFEITRGQRGGLGWTIKAASVARAKAMDEEARKAFGDPGAA